MIRVDLNKTFTLLDGECVLDAKREKPEQMNKFLGNLLVKAPAKNDACMQLELGQKIYKTEMPIDLEKAEVELIIKIVKEAKLSTLIEGYVQKALVTDVKKG